MFAGLQLKIAIALVVAGLGTGAWFYVRSLQAELEAGKIRESKYTEAIAAKDAVAEKLQSDLGRMAASQERLNEKLNEAQANVTVLQKKFADAENRASARSALKSPSDTEMRINRGTVSALRCNELVTGAPLTPDEKAGKVINAICPEFFPKPEAQKK
jgi:predicted RNase H-like nuclease (RuvC/YqgF family)